MIENDPGKREAARSNKRTPEHERGHDSALGEGAPGRWRWGASTFRSGCLRRWGMQSFRNPRSPWQHLVKDRATWHADEQLPSRKEPTTCVTADFDPVASGGSASDSDDSSSALDRHMNCIWNGEGANKRGVCVMSMPDMGKQQKEKRRLQQEEERRRQTTGDDGTEATKGYPSQTQKGQHKGQRSNKDDTSQCG